MRWPGFSVGSVAAGVPADQAQQAPSAAEERIQTINATARFAIGIVLAPVSIAAGACGG